MASTVNTSLESFTAGAETAVDVAQIQRQLRDLWQLAAESQKDPTQRRITRACLFNLVAYCETDTARDQITGILSEVTSRHPCRAIVALAQPGATLAAIGASITAHCHLAGSGGKQVCCEQISIHADGASVSRLPGAVLPLLESDLPTVLWWHGDLLGQPELFRRLSAVSDRVILDSSVWPMERWVEMARAVTDKCADLSWTRLALWQQLLAEAGSAAAQLNHCEIVYGCGPGARMRAQLLAGWVAAQLGWSVADARTQIQLSCREDRDATGIGLISATLKGADVEVTVLKNHGKQSVSVTVNNPGACGLPRTRALWQTDEASLLCQELDHASVQPVYRRALAMAMALG